MVESRATQRVAAILAADAVGYTRLMAAAETATIEAIDAARAIFVEHIEANQGRVVDTAGDSVLAVFETTAGALLAAVTIQGELAKINEAEPDERRMPFRIGIHLGDIHEKADGTVYGDGVNVAARLQGIAEAGTIIVSDGVQGALRARGDVGFSDAGSHEVKNIAEPVHAYRVLTEAPPRPRPQASRKTPLATLTGIIVIVLIGIIAKETLWPGYEQAELSTSDVVAPGGDIGLAMPTGPKIAVLPFKNMSRDPAQDYFSDGVSEDIITALSRFWNLFVLARNTTFRYRDRATDVAAIGRELGARYVLDGSVRRSESRLRITAELIDVTSGGHLWGETYDRDLTATDIFDVQDEITGQVVVAIGGLGEAITQSVISDSRRRPTKNLSAYECVLHSFLFQQQVHNSAEHLRARECLQKAVELDPNYPDAWARLSYLAAEEYRHRWNEAPDVIGRALRAAQQAVLLDENNQLARMALAEAHFIRGEIDQFSNEAERAIALNLNNASVLAWLGLWMSYSGEWERGLNMIDKARALNPKHPGWYQLPYYFNHYRKGEYQDALIAAQKIDRIGYPWRAALIATALAQLGHAEEARAAAAKTLEMDADFESYARQERLRLGMSEALVDELVIGLRKAGFDIPDAAVE